ncbi:hypothetical protein FRC10_001915 [Ceratobasidium sp. 414]|nr:hypothetical protein FRC10_001915 [Ceratobasidium sp. 414]
MLPLRAESSTVSLPPRERALAKRRAKAIKLGLSPSISRKSPAKVARKRGKAPAPAPTLAATRKRRAAADVAYLDRPDGYHIKRVVRRLPTPGSHPPIPYLQGQEDIPHSDAESDGSDETMLELTHTANLNGHDGVLDIAAEADETPTELDPDLLDYDAEGEDEDEAAQPVNVLANASEEDIQALFGSLGGLHFSDGPSTTSGHFPSTQGHDPWDPFAMHHLNTAVNDLQIHPSMQPHSSQLHLADGFPCPQPPPSRVPTPAPWIVVPEVQAPAPRPPTAPLPSTQSMPPPPASNTTRYTLVSHSGIPTGLSCSLRAPTPSHTHPRLSTRDLVSQIRGTHTESPHPRIPTAPTGLASDNLRTHSLPGHISNPPPLGPTPLRISLSLPNFLQGAGNNGGNVEESTDPMPEGEEQRLDSSASRPSTPVALDDTDVGLDESSPIQVSQARSRATRFLNARTLLPHRVADSPCRIPTILEHKARIRRLYKLNHRKHRSRHSAPTPESSRRSRAVLRSNALTPDQQLVMSPMEYHVLKDIVCINPWPEDREAFLLAAEKYSADLTGISGPDIFTQRFLDTVYYKTSGNRGNSLTRVEVMMEQEFAVTIVDKPELYQLMSNDQFLYPTFDRDPTQYFCVGALGAALEIIFFKSSKTLGLAFMEHLCQPDDAEECVQWHRKLRDRTARKGVPPGAIAFAATQMYWALEKMYLGTNIHFDEQRFRGVWDRYLRALIKLPHLGQLRIDLLDRLKDYYMDHWPSEEQDDDDDSFPAW